MGRLTDLQLVKAITVVPLSAILNYWKVTININNISIYCRSNPRICWQTQQLCLVLFGYLKFPQMQTWGSLKLDIPKSSKKCVIFHGKHIVLRYFRMALDNPISTIHSFKPYFQWLNLHVGLLIPHYLRNWWLDLMISPSYPRVRKVVL